MSDKPDSNSNEAEIKSEKKLTLLGSIKNNALILGVFALACTCFIALTFMSTEDDIEQRIREARLRALLEIVPTEKHNNDMLQDNISIFNATLGHRKPAQLFLAKQNGQALTLIYPATARDGYSGDINYIVGINLIDETIAGVRVLSHKETPGLGDKVDMRKSSWILGFNGKSLANPPPEQWTVKKDGGSFDSFTGATITPRAVIKSVASVLRYHQQNANELLTKLLNTDNGKKTVESE